MERAFGLEIPRNLAEVFSPRRTALLVYDMQVGVVRQHAVGVIARCRLRLPCPELVQRPLLRREFMSGSNSSAPAALKLYSRLLTFIPG